MAGLHFNITGDNSNLLRKLQETERGVKSVSKTVENEGVNIEVMFNRIAKSAAAFGAGFTAKEFIAKAAQVRGEFQKLEVAFSTMLGSKEKAEKLMSQMVQTAATTPFSLQDVAGGAKQLLAYGVAADDINNTLIRLGDIAAGLSIPLGDLVYLYGTTRAQGRLYTEDFNQFTSRGIPMISELAKMFGVAESEVKGLVETGSVGFPEVQKVIENLTNEGGKFGGLMGAQSKTIAGQISNIEDSISQMYNEIGQANEEIISEVLNGVSSLVENYEAVGKSILELVGVYGAYRAVLITITALQKAHSVVLAQSAVEQKLAAAAGITLSNSQALAASRAKLLQIAQAALNKTMLANPYVAVAAAVTTLGYGLYKLATYQTDTEKAQLKLNDAIQEFEKVSLGEQRELAKLKGELSALEKGTDAYNAVKEKIVKGYGKYYSGLEEEIDKIGLTEQAYNSLTEAINKSFGTRQYQKFKSEQQTALDETISENLGKIQDRLIDELGEEAGGKYYAKIRDAIIQGNIKAQKSSDGTYKLSGLDKETMEALDKVAGVDGGFFDIVDKYVERYIGKTLDAIKLTDKLDKKARERFGIDDKKTSSSTKNKTDEDDKTTYKQDYEKAKKEWEDAKKKLTEIEKDKAKFTSKQYEEAKKRVETTEKKYKDLGGITGSSLTKQDNKPTQDAEEQKQKQEKLYDELLELRFKNQQDEINLMEDGREKKRAQLDLDFKMEYAEIKKLEKLWSKKNGGTLTQEQSIEISRRYTNAENKYGKGMEELENGFTPEELRKSMDEYLAVYGEYQDKRKAIIALGEDKKKGKNKWEQKTIDKETSKQLSELDEEAYKTTSAITRLFGDMKEKTLKDLKEINEKGEEALEFLKGGEWDALKGKEFGITEANFKEWSQDPAKIEAVTNAIKENQKAIDELRPAYDKVTDGVKKFFAAGSDPKKVTEALDDIKGGLNGIMQVTGFLSDMFSNLGDAFGFDALSGIADGLNVATDAVNSAMQGASAGAIFGPIGAAAGAALGLVSSLASSIAKIHDKKHEKEIQRMQDQIDRLGKAYDKLGKSIEKSFSTDSYKLIEQQNEMLEKQKLLIYQQIEEEREKKKADEERIKQFYDQIDSINQTIADNKDKAVDAIFGEDIQSAISRFVEAYIDAWDTITEKSKVSRDFINSLIEEIVVELMKQEAAPYIEDIRKMLVSMMDLGTSGNRRPSATTESNTRPSDSNGRPGGRVERTAESASRTTRPGRYEQAESVERPSYTRPTPPSQRPNNNTSQPESYDKDDLYEKGEELTSFLDDKFGSILDWLADMKSEAQEQQSASSRGFGAEMTHEDAGELSGRFTALYEVGLQILQNISILQTIGVSVDSCNTTLAEIKNLMVSSNGHLEDISVFTKKILVMFGSKLDEINLNIKNGLQ